MSGPALSPEAPFDQKANSAGIYNRGFRPELYTVAAGTYASNAVYGVAAAVANSYASVQLARGTTTIPNGSGGFVNSTEGCEIRQHGSDVEFLCSITLNGNTDPDFSAEELRIKPRNLPGAPGRYKIPLPLPSRFHEDPVFENVEIQNKAGVQIAPDVTAGVGTWLLEARLLKDGTLALLKKDISVLGTQQTALVHNDINAGFAADQVINITIRGTYKTDASKLNGLNN